MAQVKPSDRTSTGEGATMVDHSSSPMPIRESQVENGVRFLLHRSVVSTPLKERTAFLVKKGLSREEIDMAITRALELKAEGEEGIEEVEPFWKRVLLPAVAIGGGAAALAAAMPRLETVSTVLNQRSSSGEDEEEPTTSSSTAMECLVNEVCNLSTAIESQSSQLGDAVGNMQTVASSLERENLAELRNVLERQTTELKTDLAAIRQLLTEIPVASIHGQVQDTETGIQSVGEGTIIQGEVERKEEGFGDNSNEEGYEKLLNDRLLDVKDALSLLSSENSNSTLQKAIPMLKLFLSNLVKHPDVPRYWSQRTDNDDKTMNNKLLQEALAGLEELKDADSVEQSIAVGERACGNADEAEEPSVSNITYGD